MPSHSWKYSMPLRMLNSVQQIWSDGTMMRAGNILSPCGRRQTANKHKHQLSRTHVAALVTACCNSVTPAVAGCCVLLSRRLHPARYAATLLNHRYSVIVALTLFRRVTQNTALVRNATSTNQVNHLPNCQGRQGWQGRQEGGGEARQRLAALRLSQCSAASLVNGCPGRRQYRAHYSATFSSPGCRPAQWTEAALPGSC